MLNGNVSERSSCEEMKEGSQNVSAGRHSPPPEAPPTPPATREREKKAPEDSVRRLLSVRSNAFYSCVVLLATPKIGPPPPGSHLIRCWSTSRMLKDEYSFSSRCCCGDSLRVSRPYMGTDTSWIWICSSEDASS